MNKKSVLFGLLRSFEIDKNEKINKRYSLNIKMRRRDVNVTY